MSRGLTSAAESAVTAAHATAIVLVEMDFPDGFVRVNNSPVTYAWNGYDWLGLGSLGSMDAINEGAALEARGISFRISGVPAANIARALGQQYQGRACKVWAAPLDPTSHAMIADPVLVFWGRMDVMSIDLGDTASITVSAESRLADWGRPRIRRFNHEDQQIDYPGDLGFEFVTSMVDKELRWGW
ncbi:MAG: hypothetical protein KJ787_13890 [Gammaproteobacteria bacterium]|nr:hypothetical protein [Gammaproteobacteria bacterium]MBU1647418.1 hypothetical protein [Gammaproteobacteria bacterium]MBU1973210.1 hypothetical protein [Gammaproteobacteria bacterium]